MARAEATKDEPPLLGGLRWAVDGAPGITRRKSGKGFTYRGTDGGEVDGRNVSRIEELVIPPAWIDVWIAPHANWHIQATGRDARGRKQYIYHREWRRQRDEAKFGRMLEFGRGLPRLRKRVDRDLRQRGAPIARVLAAAVRLLDHHPIRVGNEEYARTNHSYGLTTLRERHVEHEGDKLRLHFTGKSGKEHLVELTDPRLGRAIRACEELPGQALFQYAAEDGSTHRIHSDELNAYIRQASGGDFTAKDFRTWSASVMAAGLFAEAPDTDVERPVATERWVVREVAALLGNTQAVCRQCYIHPRVFEAARSGDLQKLWSNRSARWRSASRSEYELLFLALMEEREASCKRTATRNRRRSDSTR